MTTDLAALLPPRLELGQFPTPLHEASRLRAAFGGSRHAPRILIKRDDMTGFGLGGNKVRKLEFVLAEAVRSGATTVVGSGGRQSNLTRVLAAAAARLGLECFLVLTPSNADVPEQGNLLLARLFGASIVETTEQALETTTRVLVAQMERTGHRSYVVPIGASNGLGAVGYVAGGLELADQLELLGVNPVRLYCAGGSMGTAGGLALAGTMLRLPHVMAVAVSTGDKFATAQKIANEAADALGIPSRDLANNLAIDAEHIGPGYGRLTPEATAAIGLFATTEGVLLDPVYTAKAAAALIGDIRKRCFSPDQTVVFLHTGGHPALFAYEPALQRYQPSLMENARE